MIVHDASQLTIHLHPRICGVNLKDYDRNHFDHFKYRRPINIYLYDIDLTMNYYFQIDRGDELSDFFEGCDDLANFVLRRLNVRIKSVNVSLLN